MPDFPYCGFLLDTKTLDFSIDAERLLTGRELRIDLQLTRSYTTVIRVAQEPRAWCILRRLA